MNNCSLGIKHHSQKKTKNPSNLYCIWKFNDLWYDCNNDIFLMSSPRLPMPLFENETFNDFNIIFLWMLLNYDVFTKKFLESCKKWKNLFICCLIWFKLYHLNKEHNQCHMLYSFFCSMIWGKRWLFISIILMVLLTITVSFHGNLIIKQFEEGP